MNLKQLTLAILILRSTAFAEWQTGLVTGIESQADEDKTISTFVVPWLAFENDHWHIDPANASYKWQLGHTYLQSGLVADYNTVFDNTADGIALQHSVVQPLGPVMWSNTLQWPITNWRHWQSQHRLSATIPVKNSQLNAGVGVQFEDNASDSALLDNGTWLGEVQWMKAHKSYRAGLTTRFEKPFDSQESNSLTVSMFLIKVW